MTRKTAAIEAVLPRKEPVQERSRKRFERILTEATGLIADDGVDAITMRDIADAAEISIASLYQYFPDKAAIIATLADRFYREGQACVQALFSEVHDRQALEQALHEMVDSYFACFEQVPGAMAIWQATQSDRRLQLLDAEDCAHHEQTLHEALVRVDAGLGAEAAMLAKLLVGLVASAVRSAITLPPAEARALLEMCKHKLLSPAIATSLAPR